MQNHGHDSSFNTDSMKFDLLNVKTRECWRLLYSPSAVESAVQSIVKHKTCGGASARKMSDQEFLQKATGEGPAFETPASFADIYTLIWSAVWCSAVLSSGRLQRSWPGVSKGPAWPLGARAASSRARATLLRSTARGLRRAASGESHVLPLLGGPSKPEPGHLRDFLRQDADAHDGAADVDGPSDEAAAEVDDELALRRICDLQRHIERFGEAALRRGHTGSVERPLGGS